LFSNEIHARDNTIKYTTDHDNDYDIINVYKGRARLFTVNEINFDKPFISFTKNQDDYIIIIAGITNQGDFFKNYTFLRFRISNYKTLSAEQCDGDLEKPVPISADLALAEDETRLEIRQIMASGKFANVKGCRKISYLDASHRVY